MASSSKRTGKKNVHQKDRFKAYRLSGKREENKKMKMSRDERRKEKARSKKRHRHIWNFSRMRTSKERIFRCPCDKERIKQRT